MLKDRTSESNEIFETFTNRTIEKATEFGMDCIVFQAWLDVGVLSTTFDNREYEENLKKTNFRLLNIVLMGFKRMFNFDFF
ncbi:Uncharacterized protein PRO82_000196 [Candidatus Protochlamydia amoebophila]|uniref:hypothetical protein n=1 Tax=Candidatus Protochlamydia amoebophila TaxID=362787 RepID=UPI001BCA0B0D|nr:hypothetical protein [Candidatus Protochlamydia amoebophila]MBS4162918.1 Uncharacterized protein [Candidatus Protochlamydia amoebophila]